MIRQFLKLSLSSKLIILLMLMPQAVFSLLPVYKSGTPSSIDYVFLDYRFGIIQVLVLCIGFYWSLVKKKKYLFTIFFIQFIREIIVLLAQDKSLFWTGAYEMYLCILVGISFVYIVYGTKDNPFTVFKLILVSNILPVFLSYCLRLNEIEGRYNGSNLDVGATGFLCAITFFVFFFNEKKNIEDWIVIGGALIALFLSGSRMDLLLVIVFTGVIIVKSMFNKRAPFIVNTIRLILISAGFLVAIVFLVRNIQLEERYNLVNRDAVEEDGSFIGRMLSLEAGLDILKEHPTGISGYFINLQQEMNKRDYPTFPHSSVLTGYLVYGPVFIVLILCLIRLIIKMRLINKLYFTSLLYLLISSTISGGIVFNFKILFLYGMLISLALAEKKRFVLNVEKKQITNMASTTC